MDDIEQATAAPGEKRNVSRRTNVLEVSGEWDVDEVIHIDGPAGRATQIVLVERA